MTFDIEDAPELPRGLCSSVLLELHAMLKLIYEKESKKRIKKYLKKQGYYTYHLIDDLNSNKY